jgi:hypothetical protein
MNSPEVYPALWNRSFPREGRDCHQHDAYSIAAWMRLADKDGSLSNFANPPLEEEERKIADIEGWILGVLQMVYGSDHRKTAVRLTDDFGQDLLKRHYETSHR